MKNKKIVKLLALILGLFPSAALAQWALPGGFNLPAGSISGIIMNFADWILIALGVIGIIGFVISGIMYLLSAGNEETIKKAKSAMVFSIVGVIVGLAGLVIIQAVDAALNAATF
jgi:hypothetical protein